MGRTQPLLALGACALALQPVAGLFSTTLSGAPTEAIQPGTPGAQTLEVRRCCAVSSELLVGACSAPWLQAHDAHAAHTCTAHTSDAASPCSSAVATVAHDRRPRRACSRVKSQGGCLTYSWLATLAAPLRHVETRSRTAKRVCEASVRRAGGSALLLREMSGQFLAKRNTPTFLLRC